MDSIAESFSTRCGFPGLVGAFDGTHIPIPAPVSEHRASFIIRKGYASIRLQVECDTKFRFLDTSTGWPGSIYDARVLRNSAVSGTIQELPEQFHVLSDLAYGLTTNLLVPYRDTGHLDRTQKLFNKAHASIRVDVERAIGLLKCNFRRPKFLDMLLIEDIPDVVTASCVLHKFILDRQAEDDVRQLV